MTKTACDMPLPDSIPPALAALAGRPRLAYPWTDVADGIPLLGYGSLMNAASAAQTLAPSRTRPVITFGVRRVFEYDMGDMAQSRYGEAPGALTRAALNVRFTGVAADAVNGVLFDVPAADVPALRLREIDYDLQPVVCLPWEEWAAPPFVAYVLSCPPTSSRVNARLLPQSRYAQTCRDGAASVSPTFLAAYLASTYLADGVTRWSA